MRVRAFGHPVHPMLIVVPLGLFVAAVVFDLIDVLGGSADFGTVGFWNIVGGLIGAALAAATGWLDWAGIPAGTRAKRVGVLHATANLVVAALFLLAVLLRAAGDDTSVTWPLMLLELVAIAVGGVAGWLGGELVDRLGIGVDPDANPQATSSLSRRTGRH